MLVKNNSGYTLVELLLAMALFSFMLLIMTAAVIQLFHIYTAGVELRTTQLNARTIAQQMTGDIKIAKGYVFIATPVTLNGNTEREDELDLIDGFQETAGPTAFSLASGLASGTQYYIKALGGAGGLQYGLFRQQFLNLPVQQLATGFSLNGSCGSCTFSGSVPVSTADAGIVNFTVNAGDPSVVDADITIASLEGLDPTLIDFSSSATHLWPTCSTTSGSQYCSLTHITVGAATRDNEQAP